LVGLIPARKGSCAVPQAGVAGDIDFRRALVTGFPGYVHSRDIERGDPVIARDAVLRAAGLIPALMSEAELADHSGREYFRIAHADVDVPYVRYATKSRKCTRGVLAGVLEREASVQSVIRRELVVDARRNLVAVELARPAVDEVVDNVARGSLLARSIRQRHEGRVSDHFGRHGVELILRDNIARVRISNILELPVRSGYLARAAWIEKLPAPEGAAHRVGGGRRRLQVAAEIAIALFGRHDLRHRGAAAPLPVLLLIDEEERVLQERNRTAQVASELVLVVLWRARLPGRARIALVAREAARIAVEEVARLCLVVPIELPHPTVPLRGPGLGDHVHLRSCALAEFCRVVVGLDFEFLERIDTRLERDRVVQRVRIGGPVDLEGVLVRAQPVRRKPVRPAAPALGSRRHTRHEPRKL